MAASSSDVLALTRNLYAKTGDRDQTIAGLQSMGYSKGDATAAVDQVAPVPAKETPTPAPAAKQPAPGKGRARAGGAPKRPRTPPSSPRSNPGAGLPSPTLSLPRRPDAGDAVGFGLGLVLYALFLQYIKYGPGGPTAWLKAKFLNQPEPVEASEDDNDGAGAADPGLVSTRPNPPRSVNG